MSILSASQARANLYRIIDETAESHEPVLITGKRNNAVLISEDDWKAIQETIYLNSIPGISGSIIKGMKTPS
ncbi:MAG: type II toxin-antitoxin system Phd/YefM family antitoxin [Candidatus Anammoxibacter sp.]